MLKNSEKLFFAYSSTKIILLGQIKFKGFKERDVERVENFKKIYIFVLSLWKRACVVFFHSPKKNLLILFLCQNEKKKLNEKIV